jgi:hypothetical protein
MRGATLERLEGEPEVELVLVMTPQEDLPPGPTWRCSACRTRIRTGQPHSAQLPWPHYTVQALLEGGPS